VAVRVLTLREPNRATLARLSIAVQMPKPQARSDWYKAVNWMSRTSEQVVDFEDRQSIEAKIPDLLSVA
jgi:hypothetical protein